MNHLAMIALMIILALSTVFLLAAMVLWFAGRRIESRIREIDSQIQSAPKVKSGSRS